MLVWWNVCSVRAAAYIALDPNPSYKSTVKSPQWNMKITFLGEFSFHSKCLEQSSFYLVWASELCISVMMLQKLCCRPNRAFPFDALFLQERFSLYNTVLVSQCGYRFQRILSVRAFSLCSWRRWEAVSGAWWE